MLSLHLLRLLLLLRLRLLLELKLLLLLLLSRVLSAEHLSSFLLLGLVSRDEFSDALDVSGDAAPVVVGAGPVCLPGHARGLA